MRATNKEGKTLTKVTGRIIANITEGLETEKGDHGTCRNRLWCRGGGIRTHDLCVPNAALYQLSHTPKCLLSVPLGRLELPTFSFGNYCSIH